MTLWSPLSADMLSYSGAFSWRSTCMMVLVPVEVNEPCHVPSDCLVIDIVVAIFLFFFEK